MSRVRAYSNTIPGLERREKTVWHIVQDDFMYCAEYTPFAVVERYDRKELAFQCALARTTLNRPVSIRRVTVKVLSNIPAMPKEEMLAERDRRQAELRSGKRKVRL
jgi:hypothetical protein